MVLLYRALRLVEETRATLSTNQMQTKTNLDLVTPVFLRLRPVTCSVFTLSSDWLACDVNLRSDWLLFLVWFWF